MKISLFLSLFFLFLCFAHSIQITNRRSQNQLQTESQSKKDNEWIVQLVRSLLGTFIDRYNLQCPRRTHTCKAIVNEAFFMKNIFDAVNVCKSTYGTPRRGTRIRSYEHATPITVHQFLDIESVDAQAVLAYQGTLDDPFQLWIGIRGSTTLNDWLTNLNFKLQNHIHSGFLSQANALYPHVLRFLNRYRGRIESNSLTVIFTGHSLGGAVAQILGYKFSTLYDQKLNIISFGSPRVGDGTFALGLVRRTNHWRVSHNADPIPEVPLHTMPECIRLIPAACSRRRVHFIHGSTENIHIVRNRVFCVAECNPIRLLATNFEDHRSIAYINSLGSIIRRLES